jgi:flagellar biosynthesis protein FliQ
VQTPAVESAEPQAVPQLRPLGIGEILDVAIKITTRHFWTLARAVLVVVVPLQLVSSIVDLSVAEGTLSSGGANLETDEFGNPQLEPSEIWTFFAAVLVSTVLGLLAQTIATGACFKAVTDAYLGRTPSWLGSTSHVLRRLHSILWISFLTYFLGGLAFLACVIPGVWLFIAWTVAIPAFLTEEVKGRRALGRSFRLVRDFWWRTFAIILLGAILAGIVSGVLVGLLTAVTFTSDSTLAAVVASFVASVAAGVITTPFIAAVTIVLYIDLRVRKEGFDLALLAERLGEGGDPATGASLPAVLPAPAVLPPPVPTYEGGEQPPFWPPPPGWKPGSGSGSP